MVCKGVYRASILCVCGGYGSLQGMHGVGVGCSEVQEKRPTTHIYYSYLLLIGYRIECGEQNGVEWV
jgi:hypothetical protein